MKDFYVMKKTLCALGLCSSLLFSTALPAYADEHADHKEQHVEHYDAIKIESSEHALKTLKAKTTEIGVVLSKEGELEFTDLENIHEISYTLEDAVDYLREEKVADLEKIDAIDEAVQALHYASENQEEEKTRTWFATLEEHVMALHTVSKEASNDAAPAKQDSYVIVIKDHKFSPEEIIVPAGEKIKLIIDNQDPTPEEFESHDMNREKIISGNKKAKIFVGPLKPGKYHFFGEFNMDTANGYIIAK